LPAHGQLLISTDLHGNSEDFRRLRAVFFQLREAAEHPDTVHWASLGDLVHGPNASGRQRDPERFGYADDSPALVEAMIELRDQFPDNFHLLLGNHDHGHIGGPHTSKFHLDEVVALERRMQPDAIARMHALFRGALLAAAAPCGLLLCHGSPDAQITSLEDLDHIDLTAELELETELELAQRSILRTLLTSYGQSEQTTATLLRQLSRPGLELRVVVHGHDVDLNGWYTEHGNQACPVLFGAAPARRRYLVVDLGARYERAEDLREGEDLEARYLYPELV
jgi:hypothetical protein